MAEAVGFARRYFEIHKTGENGKSLWQQHEAIYQDTGIVTELFNNPPSPPFAIIHVWVWFCALSASRQNGMSINPISWADIYAYFAINGIVPQKWELSLLINFDMIFIDVMTKEAVQEIGSSGGLL